jgi:hypothetical protein
MARRVLRIASLGVAGGSGFGFLLGAFYFVQAIRSWNGPGMSGLLAGWAVVVWAICGAAAWFASWSWRASFRHAAMALIIAGAITGYWAIVSLGHDLTPWLSIALGLVTVTILGSVAAAGTLLFIGNRGTSPNPN